MSEQLPNPSLPARDATDRWIQPEAPPAPVPAPEPPQPEPPAPVAPAEP